MKPMLAIAALVAAFGAAGCDVKMTSNAAAAAEINAKAGGGADAVVFEFPTRAAGMWRTVSSMSGQSQRQKNTSCHRYAQRIDKALDLVPVSMLHDCAVSTSWTAKTLVVKHHCQSGSQRMTARTTVSGDFKTHYAAETLIDFNPAYRGQGQATIISTAERTGDCP